MSALVQKRTFVGAVGMSAKCQKLPGVLLRFSQQFSRRTLFEDEVDALIEGKRLTGGETV